MASLDYIVTIAAIISALFAVGLFVASIIQATQARQAAYYAARRGIIQSSIRKLTLAVVFLGVAVLFGLLGMVTKTEPARPPPTLTLVPTALPTQQPTVPSPTIKPSIQPTLTPSPIPINPTATAATNDPKLSLRVISSGITSSGEPLNTGTEFTHSATSIYIFYEYRNLQANYMLNHEWWRDGALQYQATESLKVRGDGIGYVAWSPGKSFAPGLYEVRFMLETKRQFVANFVARQ